MQNIVTSTRAPSVTVPVIALSLYAVASGYLMSLIPLMLTEYAIPTHYASWLASAFYAGLLCGALVVEPVVHRVGHRNGFVASLAVITLTVIALPLLPHASVWLLARFIAGIAVAAVFVIVESWLLAGDESSRAKRLGLYMLSLYGGSTLGQFGISVFGVSGSVPFIAITLLIVSAMLVLILIDAPAPHSQSSQSLSWRQISKLNHAAIIGCVVSGLTLGSIYGLMPIELQSRQVNHQQIGSLMALIILGGMVVQPVVTALNKHVGRTLLMALFCILGIFAIGLSFLASSMTVLAVTLFLLGMATFALYPIAINLGCEGLEERFIVSAAQVMLFSYSVGSVVGPMVADRFMGQLQGLMGYLFSALLATCVYMLLAATKSKPQVATGL